MAELIKGTKAWFPARARHPYATGLLLHPRAVPTSWFQYHHHLADRLEWMLETHPTDRSHLLDLLEEAGLGSRPYRLRDLFDLIREGGLQERLSLVGVEPTGKGQLEDPAWLKRVSPIEWASSLLESEPDR